MPSPLPPPPRPSGHPSAWCVDPPSPEEVHVLLLGLDGLVAAAALRLLECGVLGLNVNDPSPVTPGDVALGGYRPADVGRPREAALRRRLREQDPRCAPVSGPELFPGALLPGTVVVHGVAAPSRAGHAGPDPWGGVEIDPAHPLLSVQRADEVVLQWPVVPWAHRPCPDCLRSTLDHRGPGAAAGSRDRALGSWARPAFAAAVAARLAVDVLATGLAALWVEPSEAPEGDDAGGPPHAGTPRGGGLPDRAAVLRPPLPWGAELVRIDRSRCLCGLAQA